MRYVLDEDGNFNGQIGYGYIFIEKFIDGCCVVNDGKLKFVDLDVKLFLMLKNIIVIMVILEVGRRSIDEGREVGILIENGVWKLV